MQPTASACPLCPIPLLSPQTPTDVRACVWRARRIQSHTCGSFLCGVGLLARQAMEMLFVVGPLPGVVRHGCGVGAARVWRGCGAGAARVRRGCGAVAARVRRGCGAGEAWVRRRAALVVVANPRRARPLATGGCLPASPAGSSLPPPAHTRPHPLAVHPRPCTRALLFGGRWRHFQGRDQPPRAHHSVGREDAGHRTRHGEQGPQAQGKHSPCSCCSRACRRVVTQHPHVAHSMGRPPARPSWPFLTPPTSPHVREETLPVLPPAPAPAWPL